MVAGESGRAKARDVVPTLQEALLPDGREPVGVNLRTVNRRGHAVVIRVTASGLHDDRRDGAGVVLVMDQVEEGGAADG